MLSYNKIKEWIVDRWKILVAFLGLVFGALTLYLRSKNQKEVLQNANESHKKELEVNKEAEEKIVKGIEEIQRQELEKLEKALEDNNEKAKKIKKKKREAVEKAASDDDLAEKLANKIGADFVE